MTRPFADDERTRIGWVATAGRPDEPKLCHRCRHYFFRDGDKTRLGNGGSFGHLVACCRILENVGGSVRKTNPYASCDMWVRRP